MRRLRVNVALTCFSCRKRSRSDRDRWTSSGEARQAHWRNVDDPSDGAILLAMRGDLEEARALLDVEVARLDELGLAVGHA